ncbi:MAG: MFS transporter [Fluviicola sp.]|nr:MFS transporter [Fluviicola sp.]
MLTTAQLASQTTYSLLSVFIERISFYGVRSLLLMYLISDSLNWKEEQALSLYAIFITANQLMRPLGGLVADFLLGIKRTAMLGMLLQSLGCFTLVINTNTSLYAGLLLITIGSGLYSPANIAHLLRIYNGRRTKTDGALSINYLMINAGAFLGPFLLFPFTDTISYHLSFIVAGILSISGLVLTLFYKEQSYPVPPSEKNQFSKTLSFWAIIGIIVACTFYWFAYSTGTNYFSQQQFDPESAIENMVIVMIIAAILSVIWYFVSIKPAIKYMLGAFITGAAILLFQIFGYSSINMLVVPILLGLGELLFSISGYSILQRFTNQKYICTVIGCTLGISSFLSNNLTNWFYDKYNNNFLGSFFGVVGLFLTSIILLILILVFRKHKGNSDADRFPITDNSLIDQ